MQSKLAFTCKHYRRTAVLTLDCTSISLYYINTLMFSGTGYAQALSAVYVVTYYMSIVGLCLYYLVMSFQSTLPWAVCRPEWLNCVPSGQNANETVVIGEPKSSAELYFT